MRHAGVISLLLQYPSAETVRARDELAHGLSRSRGAAAASVRSFAERTEGVPLAELQRSYVTTFDFDARASLHLTYHLYGDQRRRGEALIALKRRYAEHGLRLEEGAELPDYLPVVLEFAELAPDGAGRRLLTELREPLELVRGRLRELESPYVALLDAVVGQLPRLSGRQRERLADLAAEGPPTELVGLEPVAAPSARPPAEAEP
ncbi:MAG TPA: nitrate reductase molybdenum cofactor assembly chaperone [Miltoncostaeaceae bacterium]|nr:nitrate reductase molybdenum cofactor assembly chaperone [Miltoncostaeaceae bacterium]